MTEQTRRIAHYLATLWISLISIRCSASKCAVHSKSSENTIKSFIIILMFVCFWFFQNFVLFKFPVTLTGMWHISSGTPTTSYYLTAKSGAPVQHGAKLPDTTPTESPEAVSEPQRISRLPTSGLQGSKGFHTVRVSNSLNCKKKWVTESKKQLRKAKVCLSLGSFKKEHTKFMLFNKTTSWHSRRETLICWIIYHSYFDGIFERVHNFALCCYHVKHHAHFPHNLKHKIDKAHLPSQALKKFPQPQIYKNVFLWLLFHF